MQRHRHHKMIDADGQPVRTLDIDILALPEIDRSCFTGLPWAMECRLFLAKGLEPAIVLFQPKAELHMMVRISNDFDRGPLDISTQAEQLNCAVLEMAMGNAPEAQGFRVRGTAG